jgi:MoaA/NifB/PqqE/SkfB family radical SAM enzyme
VRLALLRGRTDLLGISIDGVPESHNRIRGSARAFDVMRSRLEGVRESGLRFGFLFTLTQHNAGELEWVTAFAAEHGAAQLQVHPLEEVGRAALELQGQEPDAQELAVAWLEVQRLQACYRGRLHVHLDVVDRRCLCLAPERVLAGNLRPDWSTALLGNLISPLVVEADGNVVPLQYGFPRHYGLGTLRERRFQEMATAWRSNLYPTFQRLCHDTFTALASSSELPFVNWYSYVARAAAGRVATSASAF